LKIKTKSIEHHFFGRTNCAIAKKQWHPGETLSQSCNNAFSNLSEKLKKA
jgi:hypothetical protein